MLTQISPREGEKVLFVVRKSFAKLTKQFFKFLALFLISIFGFIISQNEIVIVVSLLILLFSLTYALYHFLIWFYDVYIVTTQRVVCVEQRGLFSKEYAEIELNKIKDVTYSIKGVFATIFKFGTVLIKGDDVKLELNYLSDPDDFQEMLKKLSGDARQERGNSDLTAQELIEYIKKIQK